MCRPVLELGSESGVSSHSVFQGFYLMQPSTTADQLASDLLVKILDKLNANEIEEIVPTIDQMIPEETLSIASKIVTKAFLELDRCP